MGEAKRRKKLDPRFGKPRLFLGQSPLTEKNMVYLKVKHHVMGISPHYQKADALFGLSQCQKCLESFPKSHWDKPFPEAFREFIQRLNEKFSYPDDDEIIGVFNPQTGLCDSRRQVLQQAMAEANMTSIKAKGKKLFTALPSWHPDAPIISQSRDLSQR